MDKGLHAQLGIDVSKVEQGTFMGRPIADLDRTDLLAVIGYLFRQTAHVQAEHHRRLDVLAGKRV